MKDRKGTKNQVADYLSRLEEEAMLTLGDGFVINDAVPEKWVLANSFDLSLGSLIFLTTWQAFGFIGFVISPKEKVYA